MDLTWSAAEDEFRAEARAWLGANVPGPLPSYDTEEGVVAHKEWEAKLFDAGWAVVSWPKEYGGREATLWEWLIFEEEYYAAGAPYRVSQNGIFLLAPTIFEYGTKEMQDRILLQMARGEHLWGQGWSEPNAGSDLAGISSKATRTDGGWLLTGQKAWCSRGAFCDSMFGLFRTDPEAQRHRGMTYFLVDLKADGVTVNPVSRLDGDPAFADVFLDDVFVPDADTLGGVNEGWQVAMATTSSERGLTLRSPGRFLATAARLIDLYRRYRDGEAADAPDPALRDRLIKAWIAADAYQQYTLGTVTKVVGGGDIGFDSSINKIFWSEMDVELHELALDLIGPGAELDDGAPAATDDGRWLDGFQFALSGPIYAGTNEIQRNVIAERVLGLPRR